MEVTPIRFPLSITSFLSLKSDVPDDVDEKKSPTSTPYKVSSAIPDTLEWFEVLSGFELNYFIALLTSQIIVQGHSYTNNHFCCSPPSCWSASRYRNEW